MQIAGLIRSRRALVAVGVVLLTLGAVYGIAAVARNPDGASACADTRAIVNRIAPLARGEVAALTVATTPRLLPELSFSDADARARTLAEWRGRVVLFNLWATWCVPCRKEMPALDALQARLGGRKFEVVAVNIDTRNTEKPRTWLRENAIERLAYYTDHSAKVFQELKAVGKAFGMPTTVLVDKNGCEIASLAGPAEWASDDAVQLIEAALRS